MSKPLTKEELNSLDGIAEDCKTDGVHPQLSFWDDVQVAVATIRELRDLSERRKDLIEYRQKELTEVYSENAKLREYVQHDRDCSLSYFQAYDPEKGFKYGTKRSSNGEWMKQPPDCTCGLDDALKEPDDE